MRRISTCIASLTMYLLLALSCDNTLHIFASSTENTTETESTASTTPTTKNLPLYQQREAPCFDRTPHCQMWASASECRKKNARNYMRDNCSYSCNLCNPLLVPWEPRTSHFLCGRTFDSQEKMGITIFTGVPQKTDFSDSPILTSKDHQIPAVRRLQHPSDYVYVASRIQDILASQANYLDDFYGDIDYTYHHRDQAEDGGRSSIDTDFTDIPDGTLLPLVELCINRHPYCVNWASKGICELKPTIMQDTCAPACGFCKMNLVQDSKISLYETNENIPSPFRRNDLFGIMDAIHEERVIADWYTSVSNMEALSKANIRLVQKDIDGEVRTRMFTEDIKKSMYVWNRGPNHVKFLQSKIPTNETGIHLQQVMILDNFTSPEVCQAVLDAVRFGVGLDSTSARTKRGDDGFPGSSKEGRFQTDSNGKPNEIEEHTARSSSQIFLFPTLKQDDRMLFAPSIERLLLKISLLTGIPAEHVEVPIKVEKFQAGEFRREVSHFRDAVQTMETMRYFESNVKAGDEYTGANMMDSTSTMQNARVFGVTLFLSDVKEGGSLYFPNMSQNIRVAPAIGRAVLFPTVVSLNGNWDYHVDSPDPIDAAYEHEDSDESFLLEDMTTIFGHDKVHSGTKYSITIFFRRYPEGDSDDGQDNDDDDD